MLTTSLNCDSYSQLLMMTMMANLLMTLATDSYPWAYGVILEDVCKSYMQHIPQMVQNHYFNDDHILVSF